VSPVAQKAAATYSRQLGSARARQLIPPITQSASECQRLVLLRPPCPGWFYFEIKLNHSILLRNRFVKHVLTHFRDFLKVISSLLKKSRTADSQRYIRVVQHLEEQLSQRIVTRFFLKRSQIFKFFPLGSPVLQRKAGYREILLELGLNSG